MRHSNVLKFPADNPGDKGLKAFAILFYAALAWAMFNPLPLFQINMTLPFVPHSLGLTGEGLGLLVVLGMLYAVAIRYRSQFMAFIRGRTVILVVLVILLLLTVLSYLPFLLILGGLYWLLVARSRRETPYFLRFHLLTALILNGLIVLPLLIMQACMGFLASLFKLAHADWFVSVMYWYGIFWPYVVALLFWGPALWLAFSVLMGRTPYIRVVTNNVRHWA
jgi:hypothetical protein